MKLILILFSINLFANTEFVFQRNTTGSKNLGTCYEVDTKTQGQSFKTRVKTLKCRPSDILYSFDYNKGTCYIIDAKNQGLSYIEKVKRDQCKTQKVSKGFIVINNKSGCYEYDTASSGKNYYKKLQNKKCISQKNSKVVWESKAKFSGKCFAVEGDSGSEVYIPVKNNKCRPDKVSYIFHKPTSSFLSGNCYEVHPKGAEYYSKRTKIENCKPPNTVYIFYTPEGKRVGNCYEIDTLTKGEKYLNKINNKFCKEAL